MNVAISNQSLLSNAPNSVVLYENGHFSSEIKSNPQPVLYSSFQTFSDRNSFKLEFTDFHINFTFYITDIEGDINSDKIVLHLALDNKLAVKAILEGNWEQGIEPTFQLKSFGMKLDKKYETPISEFLGSTLWAVLGLSSKFRILIPQLNYDLTTSFALPVNEVCKLLQERQIAYRLLVIETAIGITLPFPKGYIQGDDVESIAFCYHAIFDREFDWFANPQIIPYKADEESLSWLPKTPEPISITYSPEIVTKSIFGIEIPLGIMTGRIDKLIIDNYKEAKEALARLDGNIVEVKQRSADGVIRMISIEVPQLLSHPWSKKLQEIIDLDSKLDAIVLNKYFALATSAFEGLTEEQRESVLERPNLDEDAFDF